uniref:Integrin subunit alpha 2b n=1 Tax=Salvator merianae TaxID=96440 RepID=A0A8D0BJG4_SALMN
MAGKHASLGLFCWKGFFLLCSPVWALNLQADAPTVYSGPNESYFGFALDFYRDSKGSMNVVVGAPRDNASQPGVTEAGAVYQCPWAPNGSNCTPVIFDTKGDEEVNLGNSVLKIYKSRQWFGASVSTWKDNIVACAPLQRWNVFEERDEATETPVGSCYLAIDSAKRIIEYSPCRQIRVHSLYRATSFMNDQRYCEIGFSSAFSETGRLLLGAPGGYYFIGLIYSVNLSDIQVSAPHQRSLLWTASQQQETSDKDVSYEDAYLGYSVAFGEFNDDPESPEYVVGVPNKSETKGVVEILTFGHLRVLWSFSSEQVASYFGHTVAVADINGDGKDDILVGAPLFMERHSDRKLYEVGRVYLYLQRKTPTAYSTPSQTLTGTDVYGRFGMAIAPLGDIDQDGYADIAIGAPFAGKEGGGCVYIYRGHSGGLTLSPDQILENPFSGPAGFGFAIRGASDIDANGYPDVVVGAFRASKVAVYRSQPVLVIKAQLVLPDVLNPDNKTCAVSEVQVSCFPIQMCVRVSGKRMPQVVGLSSELQLDRMKQKFGRRVFLLQNGQSSQIYPLEVSGKKSQFCWNVTAYLRDEADFKDKLSPIIVSLNFSLAPDSENVTLRPVLYGQVTIQEQTRIILDCGEDNICIPDLSLAAHTNQGALLIGAENVVLVQSTATNAGEGAYEAELVIELPYGAYFQRANSSTQRLVCNPRKANETSLVACEIGNPMKADTEVKVDVEFSISQLEKAHDDITFSLQLRSKNSNNPNSNVAWLKLQVKSDARMELLGISAPATIVLPLITGDHKDQEKKMDDHMRKVEHIYQLQNAGPSTISGAELFVDLPSNFLGGFLLNITNLTKEGDITCLVMNDTNLLKNCSNQVSADVCCRVGKLESGHGATVTVHTVIWLQDMKEVEWAFAARQDPLDDFLIQSQAWFNVTGMPYEIQPEVLPSGFSVAKTLVEWVDPAAERSIPVWWVIIGLLVGLLLLAAFIFILWKMGFFKRNRPPTENEEELIKDHGAGSAGQEG